MSCFNISVYQHLLREDKLYSIIFLIIRINHTLKLIDVSCDHGKHDKLVDYRMT